MPTLIGEAGAAGPAKKSRIASSRAFRFGDPEPVLEAGGGYLWTSESLWNGRWYEPPLPPVALARTLNMSPHHRSAIIYKRNQLSRHFIPSRWLSRREFEKLVLDLLLMGNCYAERRDNMASRPMALLRVPAVNTRVGRDDVYWWAPDWTGATSFRSGYVFQIAEDDAAQEIYGCPEWLSALQAGLLGEAATLFRRRYYINGSHAGYILYISESEFSEADADALEAQIGQSKGPGNFRDLFLHIPNGKPDGVKLIPIGETGAKDEFLNVKSVARDDMLAAHRVPPVLLGIIPQNAGGLGDPAKAADVFHFAEIEPLMRRLEAINDWIGLPAVSWAPYERLGATPAAAPAR
ncbi:MAG: phage portal protein [Sphingomonas sp.]|nr:phage portal protein [Sphingomonas sp.]